MTKLRGIESSERMGILCGAHETRPGGLAPRVYEGPAAWFGREGLGQAFIRAVSAWEDLEPCLDES